MDVRNRFTEAAAGASSVFFLALGWSRRQTRGSPTTLSQCTPRTHRRPWCCVRLIDQDYFGPGVLVAGWVGVVLPPGGFLRGSEFTSCPPATAVTSWVPKPVRVELALSMPKLT